MRTFSRRFFLSTVGAVTFAQYFEKYMAGSPIRIRYDASSHEGRLMLNKYAQAVALMKKADDGDPLGWLFQWYTHAVRPDRSKLGEINRIYPNPADVRKALAGDTWDTCQPHFNGSNEPFFLPWHRMFVYFFERIVSRVIHDDSFALPYWNYSVSGNSQGVIPQEFRMPDDLTLKSLFVGKRNKPSPAFPSRPDVNAGEAINKNDPGALDLGILGDCSYLPLSDAKRGFNEGLDGGLHGNVHVETGDNTNMGAVPWAAADPVFWVHHCNIDRLWASWNAAGRSNPSSSNFLDQQFVFAAENGARISSKVRDFLDTGRLGYAYDKLEPVPPCPESAFDLVPPSVITLASQTTPTTLGTGPVAVKLDMASGLVPFDSQIKTLPANQRLYLLFKKLQSNIQPGVLYRIQLNIPPGQTQGTVQRVGYINFFDAVKPVGHEMGLDRIVSLDVTDIAKSLGSAGSLRQGVTVTISPSGQRVSNAVPIVGEIRLVQQGL